jgi:hypothetical protein
MDISKRNFLKIAAGTVAVAGLGWKYPPAIITNSDSALSKVNSNLIINRIKRDIVQIHLETYDHEEGFTNDHNFRRLNASLATKILDKYQKDNLIYDFQVICNDVNNPPLVVADNDFCLSAFVIVKNSTKINKIQIGYSDYSVTL